MDLYNLGLVKCILVDIVTFSVRRFVVFYVFGLQCHCIVAVHNIFTPLESLPIIVLRNRKKNRGNGEGTTDLFFGCYTTLRVFLLRFFFFLVIEVWITPIQFK